MPRLLKRFIYDDNGVKMTEGSCVLVNGWYRGIINFDLNETIFIDGWDMDKQITFSVIFDPDPKDYWPEILLDDDV